MPTLTSTTPTESLLLLQGLLVGLLQLLEPDAPSPTDVHSMNTVLDQALTEATNAHLHGVTQLLRISGSAIQRRAHAESAYIDDEKRLLSDWFKLLQAYCEGNLDADGQIQMLVSFESLPGIPELQPRLHNFLKDCLSETREHVGRLSASLTRSFAFESAPATGSMIREDAIDDQAVVVDVTDGAGGQDVAEVMTEFVVCGPSDAEAEHAAHHEVANDWPAPTDIAGAFDEAERTDPADACAFAGSDTGVSTESDEVSQPIVSIWIRPEELQLAADAVGSQMLPSISAIAIESDPDALATLLTDLEFNVGLIGNAMEMLGTAALSSGILGVQAGIASREFVAPDALINWSAALVAFLEQPSAENAELLAVFTLETSCLDGVWLDEFLVEASRIRIGADPALLADRKVTALQSDVALDVAAEVLPNVLEGMLRELPGNAERLGNAVRRLVASGDTAPIDEARRVAHTLKGDANTVGVCGLANITHSLEDVLIELYKRPDGLQPELCLVLERAADSVEEIADFLLGRGPAPSEMLPTYQAVLDWSNALMTGDVPVAAVYALRDVPSPECVVAVERRSAAGHPESVAAEAVGPGSGPNAVKSESPPEPAEPQQHRTATLTVPAALLDELQRLAGETLVMARQIDQRLGVLASMHRDQESEVRNSSSLLGKLDDLISLRGAALQSTALQAGQTVDPLELDQYNELHVVSRRLLESNADNDEYQRRVNQMVGELDELRSQQEAVNAELQRTVQRARTVPFEQINARLHRIVRQTARQLDRDVELRIEGGATLLDAELLDRVVEPIAHLLRNAIDHGIEDKVERQRAGKLEPAAIDVAVRTVSESIEIRIRDNGRGLDYDAIRRKASASGVPIADGAFGEADLARLILAPGFTTRDEATQVSGRGIGMDVVNSRVIDLRGQLSLASQAGKGLTVTMRLPVSQTMANVIIAHGHDLILGAVASSVERVVSFTPDDLAYSDDGQARVSIDGDLVSVIPIESMYGRSEGRLSIPSGSGLALLIQSDRGNRVLVSVSAIGAVSNVIVKPVSSHLPPIPSVRGMTLLGDGRLASVVDMGTLVDALDAESESWRVADLSVERSRLPRVVIADDSLSVRRALGQLMEDAGFEVVTARDGLEALELINAEMTALVLLDLEMPKLNGLEVTRFMRGQQQTSNVPVLMITSRANDKYRAQANEAGVTQMLGKPVADDELIVTVRNLMLNSAALSVTEQS